MDGCYRRVRRERLLGKIARRQLMRIPDWLGSQPLNGTPMGSAANVLGRKRIRVFHLLQHASIRTHALRCEQRALTANSRASERNSHSFQQRAKGCSRGGSRRWWRHRWPRRPSRCEVGMVGSCCARDDEQDDLVADAVKNL